jgi:ribosomal protein S1
MEEQNTMMDFMDEIEKSMKRIYKDDVLEGTIISAGEEEILVNINYTSDGIILREEMVEGYDYEPGGEIAVMVLNPHDEDGNVVLSHRKAEEIVGQLRCKPLDANVQFQVPCYGDARCAVVSDM